MYIYHPSFAHYPEHYIRGFLLIQKDLHELFEYVEPSDQNLKCYSFRIHSLLMRTCIEIEANCKAIMKENNFLNPDSMKDYRKINVSHRLSSYKVKIPVWNESNNIRIPFKEWGDGEQLLWYKAYNDSKHNRHHKFSKATFENLIDAVCGLLVILSAQFGTNDFSPGETGLSISGYNYHEGDGMESGIGGYFRIKFPQDWPEDDRYDFNWNELKKKNEPIKTIDYNSAKYS